MAKLSKQHQLLLNDLLSAQIGDLVGEAEDEWIEAQQDEAEYDEMAGGLWDGYLGGAVEQFLVEDLGLENDESGEGPYADAYEGARALFDKILRNHVDGLSGGDEDEDEEEFGNDD